MSRPSPSTLGQGLRGGTPYVALPGDPSRLLGAMHVKDTAHMPPLYSSLFYVVDGSPPFGVLSSLLLTGLKPRISWTLLFLNCYVYLSILLAALSWMSSCRYLAF